MMKKPILVFLIGILLVGCADTTSSGKVDTGVEYKSPPLDVGPVSVGLKINSNGEIVLAGEYSHPLVGFNNMGGIYWNVGFETVLREAREKSHRLFILWEDDQDNIVSNEYDIGQPFDINFAHTEWVRKLAHSGDGNLVVFVEKQVLYTDTYGNESTSCPGAPPQRVSVGMQAYVCTKSDRVRVRENPGATSPEITRLTPGTTFEIVKGPKCSENWSWWRIRTKDGTVGWMSEGGDDIDPYFICPSK